MPLVCPECGAIKCKGKGKCDPRRLDRKNKLEHVTLTGNPNENN